MEVFKKAKFKKKEESEEDLVNKVIKVWTLGPEELIREVERKD